MDIKIIRNYQICSTLFVFVLGALLHFTYEWSGENPFIAIFSSVNESVWEHLKLLFFPMVITIIIGLFYFKNSIPNFLCSKAIGILVAMAFTIIFFYTYSGILGTNISFIDFSSFFIATILGELVSYFLIIKKFKCNNTLAIVFLLFIFLCFVCFTFNPPSIGLFENPTEKMPVR